MYLYHHNNNSNNNIKKKKDKYTLGGVWYAILRVEIFYFSNFFRNKNSSNLRMQQIIIALSI